MKKYILNDDVVSYDEFIAALETAIESTCDDIYDDWLDDVCDEIKIGSLSYAPSQVLKAVDPIAYHCGFSDYVNSVYEDALYDLERGREYTADATDFKIIDDSDDEGDE